MNNSKKLLKIKTYNDCIQYTYSNVCFTNRSSRKIKKNHSSKSEIFRCSISRSISHIKELCLCNNFDWFFTLTLKTKKRNNILYSTTYIRDSIKKYAKTHKDFKYLYVFEKQKKGGIHIHGFFSGFDDLYLNKNGHLSSKFFDKVGYQCFERAFQVNPFYLIKYITKEPIVELRQRYFRSRNLKTAEISYLHCNFEEFKNFPFTFRNEYCKMITVEK